MGVDPMNVRQCKTIGVFVAAVLLGGCNQSTPDARVAPLEGKVAALEKQLEQLQFQVRLQSDFKDWDQIAYLTPGSDGYAAIKMDLGYMTVNLANIAAYANGSKVSLTFGNLTSATIDGLKATIEWGSVDEKGTPKYQETKSREVKLTEALLPGAWNKVDVVLEGVPPTALGFVRVRDVSHQGIRLRGKPR
jgi:hypothetical protein